MDEQTRKLLEECTSGCKMAVSSIQQILEFTQDSALQKILNKYIEQHTHLQQTAETPLYIFHGRSLSPKEQTARPWYSRILT